MLFLSFQKKYSWNQNLKLCLCFILSWLNLQSFPVSPLLQRFEIQVFTNGEHVEQWGTFYLGQTTNNTPRGNWELIQEVTKEPGTTQIRSVFTTHQLAQFKLHAAVSLTKQTHSTFNCERKKTKTCWLCLNMRQILKRNISQFGWGNQCCQTQCNDQAHAATHWEVCLH